MQWGEDGKICEGNEGRTMQHTREVRLERQDCWQVEFSLKQWEAVRVCKQAEMVRP